jgi:hypothetical protein
MSETKQDGLTIFNILLQTYFLNTISYAKKTIPELERDRIKYWWWECILLIEDKPKEQTSRANDLQMPIPRTRKTTGCSFGTEW